MRPPILEKIINSPGCWRVVLRPLRYQKERFTHAQIRDLLRKNAVKLRGWSFPHHRDEGLANRMGYVDFANESNVMIHRLEYLRFYQSGQFLYYGNLREDDPEQMKKWNESAREMGEPEGVKILRFVNAIYCITEFFEFARRLANGGVFDSGMEYQIRLSGSLNRLLVDDPFSGFEGHYKCHEPGIYFEGKVSAENIVGKSSVVAVDVMEKVFSLFNFTDYPRNLLEEEQAKLLERRL